MSQGSRRGVPVAAAILTALAGTCAATGTACLAVGFNTESFLDSCGLWYVMSGAFFVVAILVYTVTYWIFPYFKGSRAKKERPPIKLSDSPGTVFESNAPRDDFGEIEIKNSPNAKMRFNALGEKEEESGEEPNEGCPGED